jgi:long-chain acyl-CoA synthetase
MRQDGIVSAFERLALREPLAPLVVLGTRTATVEEVAAMAGVVHRVVEAAHCDSGDVVGLAVPNGPAFLSALLALRRRGVAALLLDPRAPEVDHRRTTEALGGSGLLRCSSAWPGEAADWSFAPGPVLERAHLPETAVVKLTSGSTGEPRGVGVSSEALLADEDALFRTMGLRAEERILAAIPMSHSYGLSSVALPALVRGSLVVLPEGGNPLAPLAAAAQAGATFFPTAPAWLQALVKMSRPPAWPDSLRLVISASARLSPDTAERFEEAYGRPVHGFYGASECGGICYDRDGGAAQRGTVGSPVEGVRVSLEEDVVTVESPAVASGYLVTGPFRGPGPPPLDARLGGGRFQTSDRGEWHNGELVLLGRVDAVINVKGWKVDPAEVESVLSRLPGVEDVVALGMPAADSGGELVRAVIACQPGRLSYESVLAFCRSRLPEHKVPRSVVLVDEIPRTARGKVSRAALMALQADERTAC